MDIQDLGAIGELVSSIAVVATLAYLAIQIRDQNRETRVQTIQDLMQSWNEMLGSFIDIPDVTDIFKRGSKSYINLDPKDQPRFAAIMGRMHRIFEGMYLQKIEGRINDDLWNGIENSIHEIFSQPGCHEWWNTRSHWFSTKYVAFMNLKIADGHKVPLFPSDNL